MPLISVIVPICNAARTLPRCVDSLLAQTYEDFELILVDDGSTDCSGILCEGYGNLDRRVRVVHQENGGVSLARNTGLDRAEGTYIAFADADDWVEPDYLKTLLETIQTANADLAQVGEIWEGEGLPPLPVQTKALHRAGPPETWTGQEWGFLRNACWGKLYRRESIGAIRFDSAFPIGEDQLFNLMVLAGIRAAAFAAKPLYHYVQTPQGVSRAAPTPEKLSSVRQMLKTAQNLFSDRETLLSHLWAEQLRNDMDICSKLVRYDLNLKALEQEVRREVRNDLLRALRGDGFSGPERRKLILIAWMWPVYRSLLRMRWRKERLAP